MALDDIEHLQRVSLRLVSEIREGWVERGMLRHDPARKRQLSECLGKLNERAGAWDEMPERETRARNALLEIAAAALQPHRQPA